MIFYQQEMSVNISIMSCLKLQEQIIEKYFPNEKKEFGKDEMFEGVWNIIIKNSSISNQLFYEFLLELTKYSGGFDIIINGNEKTYIYESFSYISNSNHITKNYLPKQYISKNSKDNLLGILYHLQEEKIELQFN